jgi:peptidoglycan/xylan/chitin deacetylase (PgdA/CDA1 family)
VKHALLRACARVSPARYRPPAGVLLPYGHIVTDAAPPHVRHLFPVPTIAKFEADLDALVREYRPLRMTDLDALPRRRDEPVSPLTFVLSFDDGLREVHDVVAPILRRRGIGAIFFVNTATLDNKQLMWRHKVSLLIDRYRQDRSRVPPPLAGRPGASWEATLKALPYGNAEILDDVARSLGVDFDEYLRTAKPYLTTDQVLGLARDGFEIGSHSDTHPYFDELSVADQEKEIATSVASLRALGLPCRYFAFPFHDQGVASSIFRHLRDLDIRVSFGTSEGRVDSVASSFQRFAIDAQQADTGIPAILKQLAVKSLMRRLSRTELIRRS